MIWLAVFPTFLLLLGTVLLVRREWRLWHAAERERPATLEGGGSHLSNQLED